MSRRARSRRFVIALECALAIVTVALGTSAALYDTATLGLSSRPLWLLAFAIAGVTGLAWLRQAHRDSRQGHVVVGLLLTALSPTGFFYALNALLLIAAMAEGVSFAHRAHRQAPA